MVWLSRPGWLWLNTKMVYPRTVTYPSTNRAQRRPTTLIKTNALPLSQAAIGITECKLTPATRSPLTEICFCILWPCDLDHWPSDLILNDFCANAISIVTYRYVCTYRSPLWGVPPRWRPTVVWNYTGPRRRRFTLWITSFWRINVTSRAAAHYESSLETVHFTRLVMALTVDKHHQGFVIDQQSVELLYGALAHLTSLLKQSSSSSCLMVKVSRISTRVSVQDCGNWTRLFAKKGRICP